MLRVFKQYYPIRNIVFFLGEFAFIFLSFALVSWTVLGANTFYPEPFYMPKILMVAVVCQLCLYYNDLYDIRMTRDFRELTIRLIQALGVSAILIAIFYMIFPQTMIGHGVFNTSIVLILLLVVSWRYLYAWVLRRSLFDQKIILLGSGELAGKIQAEIEDKRDCGYRVAVVVPECLDNVDLVNRIWTTMICKEGYKGLCDLAKHLGIRKIVVGFRDRRGTFPLKELLQCRMEGIEVLDGNTFYEMLTGKLIVQQLNPSWLIFSEGFRKTRLRRFLKRTTDLVLSVVLLVLLLPLIALTAILIKLDSKGPVIFSQERVGEKGKIYRVHKFRSMVQDAEALSGPIWAQEKDPRITRVGAVIRRLRIDEIPQLWNVLKGEMSFVGPRPEREFFVQKLQESIPYYSERISVKPGITGWAQVSYGYGASEQDAIEKLNYDLFYIKNMSALMDLMIVMRTIKIVLFGHGVR
jgi:sugar transferase (PEP-CTERM system associated)